MTEHTSILSQIPTKIPSAKAGLSARQEEIKESIYVDSLQHLPIQRKLPIGAVGDSFEDEADAMADKVMRMPETSFIQRKCAHCKDEERIQRKPLIPFIQKKEATNNIAGDIISNQIQSTKGSGTAMPDATKNFMESRFGTDFSQVNIHTGNYASRLSNELDAHAFTVGSDIYFNEGRYQPGSDMGKHLLAHELTHTIQQGSGKDLQEKSLPALSSSSLMISRFTDTNHHIIEEAALRGGGFSEEQRREIERGNVERDYSQLPPLLNFALLCNPDSFGGYHPEDHLDNYVWNAKRNVFEDRIVREVPAAANLAAGDPIQQIKDNIMRVIEAGADAHNLQYLGIAFHTIEDFFAHSNFVELTMDDFRFGHELITGSNDEGAGEKAIANLSNSVSPPQNPMFSTEYFRDIYNRSPALSHSRMAKDYSGDHLHTEARRMAALVVQDLSGDIMDILSYQNREERRRACIARIFAKIDLYLQPPDPEGFPWWETLRAADNGAIDTLLQQAERRSQATVNQCVLSPMLNLEATRRSNARSFGMANPAVGLARLALSHFTGDGLAGIGLSSIPSVTFRLPVGPQTTITIGGQTYIPFGALNTLISEEQRYFPSSQTDHGRDAVDNGFQSGVGLSINGTF